MNSGYGGGEVVIKDTSSTSSKGKSTSILGGILSSSSNESSNYYTQPNVADGAFVTSPLTANMNRYTHSSNYNNQTNTYNNPPTNSHRMEGFGNVNNQSTIDSKQQNFVQAATSFVSGSFNGTLSKLSGARSQSEDFVSGNSNGKYNIQNIHNRNAFSVNAFGQITNSIHSISPPDSNMMDGRNVEDDVHCNPPGMIVPEIPVHASGLGRAGGAAKDGSYERQILESLCESAGLKNSLNEDKLKEFLNSAPTLSVDVVGNILMDLLHHDAWQTRSKALMVISCLSQAKHCAYYHEYWTIHREEISNLASDPKTSVRTQALKVLRVLKIDTGEYNSLGAVVRSESNSVLNISSTSPQKRATNVSLIDFDLLDEPLPTTITPNVSPPPVPLTAPTSSPATKAEPHVRSNMFAGMSVSNDIQANRAIVEEPLTSVLSSPPQLPDVNSNTIISSIAPVTSSPLDLLEDCTLTQQPLQTQSKRTPDVPVPPPLPYAMPSPATRSSSSGYGGRSITDLNGVGVQYELPPVSDPTFVPPNQSHKYMLSGQHLSIAGVQPMHGPQYSGISPGASLSVHAQGPPMPSMMYPIPPQYVNTAGVTHHVSIL